MNKLMVVVIMLLVGIFFTGIIVTTDGMSSEYQEALWDLQQIPDEEFKRLETARNQAIEKNKIDKEMAEKKRQLTEEELKVANVLSEEDHLLGIGTVLNPVVQFPEGATDDRTLAVVELPPRQLTIVSVATGYVSKKGDEVIVYKKKNGYKHITPVPL